MCKDLMKVRRSSILTQEFGVFVHAIGGLEGGLAMPTNTMVLAMVHLEMLSHCVVHMVHSIAVSDLKSK